MPLTDTQCRNSASREKPFKLFDGEGLYLQVMPNGSKYWRLKYRIQNKEKQLALGVYPTVTLLEARTQKNNCKIELQKGIDPVFARLEQKQIAAMACATTFELVAREWYGKNVDAWDPRYAKTVMHRLEKYAFDDLGSYPINMLKPVIVLGCLQQIEKTAPEMARRIKQLCSHIFRYAIATDRLQQDHTIGLECALKKYRKGHFSALSVDELPKFLTDLHNYKGRLTRQTFLAINLMLLTFVRTSELIQARWTEIDFEKAMWIIPAERMKMRSPHLVPLSTQAITILRELYELNGQREFVFPSLPRPRKPMSNGTILVALIRMGYRNKMTGHGFRSLALGILKEKLGYTHEVADRQLAHVPKNSTDRAYDRAQFLSQRIEMMQKYADYFDTIFVQR